ncbi:MAG: tail fiber domain-containing protein [Thermoanaerobaculales bacterium]
MAHMNEAVSRLMELRMARFRWKTHAGGPMHFGLIAEEANEVVPGPARSGHTLAAGNL